MSINIKAIARKLEAVKSKNAAVILAEHIYLPGLGVAENIKEVQEWLDNRANILQEILDYKSVDEAIVKFNTVRDANRDTWLPSEAQLEYEQLSKLTLYKFALGEF